MLYAASSLKLMALLQCRIAKRRRRRKHRRVRLSRCETCRELGRQRCVCARRANKPLESAWWKFLHRPGVADPRSRDGRLFRRRFRVPYTLFRRLVGLWHEKG